MMNRTGNVLWTGRVTCLIGLLTMLASVARAQDRPWATQIDPLVQPYLDESVVVGLANTATMEVDALAEQLVRALAGVPERPRKFAKAVEVSAEQMQRLVGRYQLAPTFILDVKIEGDQVMVGATGQPYFRVYPQSVASWRYRVVDAALTFEPGPAAAVTLHQNGLDQRAERLAGPD